MKKKLEQTHTGGDLLAGESFLSGLVEGLLELQVQQCPRRKLVTALTSGGTTEMGTSNVSPQSLSPPPHGGERTSLDRGKEALPPLPLACDGSLVSPSGLFQEACTR